MSFAHTLFFLSNLGIFFGYLFVAVKVAPNFKISKLYTKIGGIVFFVTCGLTHADLALHAWAQEAITYNDFVSPHMLGIHFVQVIAVWVFVLGLYNEFVREDGIPFAVGLTLRGEIDRTLAFVSKLILRVSAEQSKKQLEEASELLKSVKALTSEEDLDRLRR